MSLRSAFYWFGCHTMLYVICHWPTIGILP